MTQPSHHDQLAQFAEQQLNELSTRDICDSTVHLILAASFFTGAAIGLATPLKANKKTYLASLHDFLQNRFGLSAGNAQGMVESNARLYKRYVLIEKIYNAGVKAAVEWHKDSSRNDASLKNLLTQYRDLSMSGLNIEGTKQQKVAPAEVEAIARVESAPEVVTAGSPRWGRRLLWFCLLGLFAAVTYFVVFPETIPEKISEQIPAEWLEKIPAEWRKLLP